MSSNKYPVFNVFSSGLKKKTKEVGFAVSRIAAEDIVKKNGSNATMILENIPDDVGSSYKFAWFKLVDKR